MIDAPPPTMPAGALYGVAEGEVVAGKYRIDQLLGAGGMGLVLAATHVQLGHRVAIKVMRDDGARDPAARARFAREASAAVRLKSQHVARVLDVGTLDSGAPYLVMELLEGCDLGTMLDARGGLPVHEAVAYMLHVCEAVAEAHGVGIIHRDLKPRNIFVTSGVDGHPLAKVLDFGISKLVQRPDETQDLGLTKTTDIMGSPGYMAPEQLRAARNADERSDIWSLGVILFELLTGRLPWEAESVSEMTAMIFRDAPRAVRELRSDVPPAVEQIIFKCLEKDRAQRFHTVEELAHALEPHALGLLPGAAARISTVARASRRPPPQRPEGLRPSSSSSRVLVNGGTSVSWAETEQMAGRPPSSPRPRSRAALVGAAAVVGVLAIVSGGYAALSARSAASSPPVLPDDRGANRPAEATTAPPPAPTVAPPPATGVAAATGAAPTAASTTPISSIPRRAPSAKSGAPANTTGTPTVASPAVGPAAAPPTPATPAAAPPHAPDPHDIGSIGRK